MYRELSGSLGCGLGGDVGGGADGDALATFGDGVGDIRLWKLKSKRLKLLLYVATAKSQSVFFSRSTHKINDIK
jgi:hypothetical protein